MSTLIEINLKASKLTNDRKKTRLARANNNNNNNNPICKAQECQKTSVALADRNSRVN